MVLVEDAARLLEIEVVLRHLAPRQGQDPIEVGADDAVLGRRGWQLLEPREFAPRRLFCVLWELEAVQLLPQLVDLGLLGVPLAELLLDRLQLLAKEELALALLHLGLHLRLDLCSELQDFELLVQNARHCAQALFDVHEREQLLLLLRLDPQRRCNEMAQRARIVDVRSGELQLFGQVRNEPDHACEQALHVASQRLDFARLHELVGHGRDLCDEVRLVLQATVDANPLEALDEDAQRAVGDADHLVDDRRGTDVVEIVEAWRLDLFLALSHRDQREHALAGDDVVDQLDRAVLADRERCHRLREDDGFLQRQHRKHLRQVRRREDRLDERLTHERVTSIETRAPSGARSASGRTILRMPRS